MLATTFKDTILLSASLSRVDTVSIVCERICKLKPHSVLEKPEPEVGVRDFSSLSVWAHFLSRANALKVIFGIFIRAL